MPDLKEVIARLEREADRWDEKSKADGISWTQYHFANGQVSGLERALSALKPLLEAEARREAMRKAALATHDFEPHADSPWFCAKCGYRQNEVLQHGNRKDHTHD